MKKKTFFQNAIILGFASFAALPTLSKAQGIMTFDATAAKNSYQRIAQGAEQLVHEVQSLQNQVTEIQNMVQNTLAPAAYIWNQSENSISQMQNLVGQYQYYTQYGGIQAYANQFSDANFYASSPCYNLNSDPYTCAKTNWQRQKMQSDIQTQMNRGAVKLADAQAKNLKENGQTLDRLNASSKLIQGRMQSTETTNMYLAHMAHQQMQTDQMTLANAAAEAHERAAREDKDAQARAIYQARQEAYDQVKLN